MARVLGEMQQQVELERGEVERLAAVAHLALGRQDLEVAVAQHAWLAPGRSACAARSRSARRSSAFTRASSSASENGLVR